MSELPPSSPTSTPAAATSRQPGAVSAPPAERERSAFCWTIALIGLGFLGFAHLGVVLCFTLGRSVPAWIAPAALGATLMLSAVTASTEELRLFRWATAMVTGLLLVGGAVATAGWFFDFGWDGQWYDQNAVFQMARGWNPLRDPLHTFPSDVEIWLRHYAKGPWYVALALYELTLDIESAKAATWIAFAASYACVFAAASDYNIRRSRAALLSALLALNPIAVCQLTTYLVDGLLASFLTCLTATLLAFIRRSSRSTATGALLAAILCINAKQTGLVYVCVLAAAVGTGLLIRRRELLGRFAVWVAATLLLGVALFGFNPYITNLIHRGHPFYPWAGTTAHPGFDRPGQDPNDRFEVPRNLIGHGRLHRLAYSIFGRPGAQPYVGGPDARLMWPGDVGVDDFLVFRHHGVRISGFGPLFSIAIFLSGTLLATASFHRGWPRGMVLLASGAIVASLLIGSHAWWARYVPQLWWLPVAAVLAGLAVPRKTWLHVGARVLAALLLINALAIAGVHLAWEVQSTQILRQQLAFLSTQPGVEADLGYFSVAFGERLRAAGVDFRPVPRLGCAQPMPLMSVAPGYPGTVRVCVQGGTTISPSSHEHP